MTLAQQLTNYQSTRSLGSWFRQRRSQHLRSLLVDCHAVYGHVNVIDIGGRPSYWNIFPKQLFNKLKVRVLLVNNGEEIPSDQMDSRFQQVEADACHLEQFNGNQFHLAHSNSVIEHVGSWRRMQLFAAETQRIARTYYLQTPNFNFPIEPHYMLPFFHWLPEALRAKMLQKRRLGHIGRETDIVQAMNAIQSIQLLNKTMVSGLFPDARIEQEKILGLCKSLIAIRGLSEEVKN